MPITTRTEWYNYPGAIVIVDVPFTCDRYPTIQELALALMSTGIAVPSVIVGGLIYTEETKYQIEYVHCPYL